LPGPFCSLLLADFGADVVKVEDLGAGDYMRWAPPRYAGEEQTARSGMFVGVNANKRSIRLNLKAPEGRAALLRLASGYDVVLESFRPGVMERLGLGYDQLRAINERLVYCAITGYGATGPYRLRAGHDLNYLALSGLLGVSGELDGPPTQSATQIADIGGGALIGALGILMALRERDRSGLGQFVDVAMLDGMLAWLPALAAHVFCGERPPRRGEIELGGALLCYRPYRCADGWITLASIERKFWEGLVHGVGRPDLLDCQFDRPGSPAHAELERIFAGRTRAEWQRFADAHECCIEPVLELEEALDSELVRDREMVVDFEQPGVGAVKRMGLPFKLSDTPGEPTRAPAPALGAHTAEVLGEAGFSASEIDALMRVGAAGGPVADAQGSYLAQ